MSQADYYQNGNNSACDIINSPLSTKYVGFIGRCLFEIFSYCPFGANTE
ncbi:MAG: hypothetical protein LBE12_10660 [Planctomycetaceae bacterium]|nr:hypothetical protein [Planctomycetaceae bacterium]